LDLILGHLNLLSQFAFSECCDPKGKASLAQNLASNEGWYPYSSLFLAVAILRARIKLVVPFTFTNW
jgi:hypothetical protein